MRTQYIVAKDESKELSKIEDYETFKQEYIKKKSVKGDSLDQKDMVEIKRQYLKKKTVGEKLDVD